MKRILLAVMICLPLWGCAAQPEVTVPETTQPSATAPTQASETQPIPTEPEPTVPAEPVDVYPGAVEDFLELQDRSSAWDEDVELVMLHFTSAVMISPEDPFDMAAVRSIFEENRISIHYIIDRDGTVYCYVPESRMAWHAGKGSYLDERYTDRMNHYSIGIELLAIGSAEDMELYMTQAQYDALDERWIGFTDAQYDALRTLVADICQRNEIPMDRTHILGHQDYNPEKNDPGQLFDWDRLFCTP